MREPSTLDGRCGDCAVTRPLADSRVSRSPRVSAVIAAQTVPAHAAMGRLLLFTGAAIALAACGGKPAAPGAAPPAKTELVGHETELLRLKLSPDAEQRLGLRLVKVTSGSAGASRTLQGEVVAAPLAGGLPLSASGDLTTVAINQARADGDVARARAEFDVAQKAYARAEALVREEAGSARARDEAEAARGVARAALQAAQAQRALLGPPVAGLGAARARWVRVSVFSADLSGLRRGAPARVAGLSNDAQAVLAPAVSGPPGANAATGAVDLYYALPVASALRLGERVTVDLPIGQADTGLTAPAAAILRDIYGGEWVYVRTAPQTYERRRIEVARLERGQALLTRGPAAGAEVVTDGAPELFGVEFGAK